MCSRSRRTSRSAMKCIQRMLLVECVQDSLSVSFWFDGQPQGPRTLGLLTSLQRAGALGPLCLALPTADAASFSPLAQVHLAREVERVLLTIVGPLRWVLKSMALHNVRISKQPKNSEPSCS